MVKEKVSGKKKPKMKELDQIDNVLKFTELPRNDEPMAKRSSSSSSSPASPSVSGSLQECSYDRDEASSVTLTNFNDKKDGSKKSNGSVYCSKSCDKRQGILLNLCEFPEVEAEQVGQDKVSDPCSGRVVHEVVEQKSDAEKLQVRGSNGVCITPGNVVWAKTSCQVWWPAEIIDRRSSVADSRNQQTEEDVLVKFYEKHNSAWVNAARDISMLEDCFEERSCNLMQNLQDALKQAIVQRKEHIKSCRQLPVSPDSFTQSNQQDQESHIPVVVQKIGVQTGKRASSISSKTGSNLVKKAGNKGARSPLKSDEGARRLKIMRHLGLTAPVGSPF